MADDILTPGLPVDDSCENVGAEETPNYLIKDNYLGEFETSAEKEIARTNLGVPSLEDVYNKSESSILTKQLVQEALQHLARPAQQDFHPHCDGFAAMCGHLPHASYRYFALSSN